MINTLKQTGKLLFFSLLFFVAANTASAQNIKFPVAELGNCANRDACRAYCSEQVNQAQCTAFAKRSGLDKGEQPKNRPAGNGPEGDQKILQKAKEILSCNSESVCRAICDQESNREKCSRFAKEAGIDGGVRRVGPGGCTSEETCRAYCDQHEEECRKFGGGQGDDRGGPRDKNGQPEGNGGPVCKTREECKAFCSNPANAEACKNVVIAEDENKGPSAEEVQRQMGGLRQNILQMPEESQTCIKNAIGGETYNKIMAGEALSSPIDGGAMQSCFSQGIKERDEKNTPTSKPDDYSTDYGPNGEKREVVPTTQTSQVQGVSAKVSLIEKILNWVLVK